jgi:hypothetical protein
VFYPEKYIWKHEEQWQQKQPEDDGEPDALPQELAAGGVIFSAEGLADECVDDEENAHAEADHGESPGVDELHQGVGGHRDARGFHDRFAVRRMRMHRVDDFFFGGFQFCMAITSSASMSVTFSPIMWTPSSSPYLASKISLTKPSGSPAARARPLALKGNLPIGFRSRLLAGALFGVAHAGHLRMGVGAAGDLFVVDL